MEKEEFETLYNSTKHGLRNYVSGILGFGNQYVDDVVADSFVRAWEKIHQWDPEKGAFSTWIYTIARNKSIHHKRIRARIPLSDVEVHRIDVAEDEAAIAGDWVDFDAMLDTLPNKTMRKCISMFVFDRKSYEEISVATGETLGNVKSLISRGRRKLGIRKFGIQNGRVRKGTSKEGE
jgi:RNA polymerase sigma-70 factor (ECF subfamily)